MFPRYFARHVSLLLLALTITGPLVSSVQSSAPTSLGIWSNDYFSNVIVDPALVNGSLFTVEVQVQGIPQDGLNGFDITVLYDPDVIRATNASLKAPLCPALDGCLFDTSNLAVFLQNVDSPSGTVRLAATLLGKIATGSGLLLRIVFQVVGIGTSPIDIQESESLIVLSSTAIPYKSTDGSFDNTGPPRPDFSLSVSPASLGLQVGSSGNATVYLSSLNGFAGDYDIALLVDVTPNLPNGITASLSQYTISLGLNETATSILTIFTSNSTQTGKYTITITGTTDILHHATSLSVRATAGPGAGFSFRDDFNYSSISEVQAAGWVLNAAPAQYFAVGDGVVTLLNDGSTGAALSWLDIPAGVSDWTITMRGKWIAREGKSILLAWGTPGHWYEWKADGYYGRFILLSDTCCQPLLEIPGFVPQLNVWHDLRVDMRGGVLLLYFDGVLKGIFEDPHPGDLNRIGVHSSWLTDNGFDFIEASSLQGEPFFTLDANPPSLSIEAGASSSSNIIVTSRSGFAGQVDLSVSSPSGLSALITPSSVGLTAGSTAPAVLGILTTNGTSPGLYDVTVEGASSSLAHSVHVVVTVTQPNQSPVAGFSFYPNQPFVGETVYFDGSGSFDPDGFVVDWFWAFGDFSSGYGPFPYHAYYAPGVYTVTLTVTDNLGASSSISMTIEVRQRPTHDVAIVSVVPTPSNPISGQTVIVQVGLANYGQSDEIVDVVAYFDGDVAGQLPGFYLPRGIGYVVTVPVPWLTSGVAPGDYTISAAVLLTSDEVLDNNSMSDGVVTVLPPPTLQLTPTTGKLGTKITVQGSGFPLELPYPIYGPRPVIVSFYDEFLGTSFIEDGAFRFTFNLQHAEPGLHLVKAFDVLTGLTVSAEFDVLPEPSGPGVLAVSVEVGAVYFPGDTVDVFILITLDGSPLSSPDQLQLSLIKLDGTSLAMVPRALSAGTYKASYSLAGNGGLGTYAVVAHVQYSELDASALASFEVKPSWISTQGPRIATATLAVGILATVGLAWRLGYLRKKESDPSSIPAAVS